MECKIAQFKMCPIVFLFMFVCDEAHDDVIPEDTEEDNIRDPP